MKCSKCGAELNPGSVFCSSCGNKIEAQRKKRFCRECGAEFSDGAKFCTSCGAALDLGKKTEETDKSGLEKMKAEPEHVRVVYAKAAGDMDDILQKAIRSVTADKIGAAIKTGSASATGTAANKDSSGGDGTSDDKNDGKNFSKDDLKMHEMQTKISDWWKGLDSIGKAVSTVLGIVLLYFLFVDRNGLLFILICGLAVALFIQKANDKSDK